MRLRGARPLQAGLGLPGFLPYSKKPHGFIRLHLLHPAGRPPRTHVPIEPGTLLANISESRLGVTLELVIHHLFASPWEPVYERCCFAHPITVYMFNPDAISLFGKLWQHLRPRHSFKGIIRDRRPLFWAVRLALKKRTLWLGQEDSKTEEWSKMIESRGPGSRYAQVQILAPPLVSYVTTIMLISLCLNCSHLQNGNDSEISTAIIPILQRRKPRLNDNCQLMVTQKVNRAWAEFTSQPLLLPSVSLILLPTGLPRVSSSMKWHPKPSFISTLYILQSGQGWEMRKWLWWL